MHDVPEGHETVLADKNSPLNSALALLTAQEEVALCLHILWQFAWAVNMLCSKMQFLMQVCHDGDFLM